jgi:hypothetical protein
MWSRHLLLALAVLAGPCLAATSKPVVLDFEELACAKARAQCDVGEALLSKGFALRAAPLVDENDARGLMAVGKTWRYNRRGSEALSISSCGNTVRLMANDNSPFDAVAISLAVMQGEGESTVAFTARRQNGSVMQHTASLSAKAGWQRLALPASFRQLTELAWQQGDCVSNAAHMFDQLELISHAP